MMCNISKTHTEEEIKEHLSVLQYESTQAFIPTLVYLSLLIVVGSIGNCLVLVVYSTKLTRTPLRLYIIVVAVYDLITNLLIIPGDMYDTFHVWDNDWPIFCKLRRFLNVSCVMSSNFVLVAIAITRYKMVCSPRDRQVTVNQAKLSTIVILFVSIFLSIPYSVIHGSQTISTPVPGICGHFCQIDDYYLTTDWPKLNSIFFIVIFITCCTIMFVFYICIGCKTWKHRQISKGLKLVSKSSRCEESNFILGSSSTLRSTDGPNQSTNLGSLQYRQQLASNRSRKNGIYNIELQYCNNRKEVIERKSSMMRTEDKVITMRKSVTKKVSLLEETNLTKSKNRRSIFGRTSWMMIIVSLAFLIGYIPFLGLNFYKTAAPESYASLKGISLAMYQLFFRSYLLNSAINPIVYSLFDPKFRKECFKFLTCYKYK